MLKAKPHDQNGLTIPHDHEEIESKENLIRGITSHHIINQRISKGAFKSSTDPYKGLSADLERLASERSYSSGKYRGAVKFPVAAPRKKDLLVGYDPEENNHAHCQVWRPPENGEGKRITAAGEKAICSSSDWHVEIEGVTIAKYGM